jgi:hypothetical protein
MQANTLGGKKYLAHQEIDRVAGEVRTRYITDVPGQQAVYMTKLSEARAYLAAVQAGNSQPQPGPHLAAEAAALGTTAAALAATVVATGDLWAGVLSPAIEAQRMAGKAAVQAATTPELVQQALQASQTALRAVGAT